MKTTNDYWDCIRTLKKVIENADAMIIGAGAGLSTSAGFEYSGKRFFDNFSDFADKYGLQDMYSAGFYPFKTLEEYWAYWSRYIYVNRYMDAPKPVYERPENLWNIPFVWTYSYCSSSLCFSSSHSHGSRENTSSSCSNDF